MAYQARRKKQFVEEFQLCDENGSVVHTLHVALDADDMVVRINRKYAALARALSETAEIRRRAESGDTAEDYIEKLGLAVVDMFESVFGAEDTSIIVEFYNERYIEMCREVTPFITQRVIPRCIEIKKENQEAVLNRYNKKQRRDLFGR